MSVFGLRKTWIDPVPGIAMVQAHYTCSPTGVPPDWAGAEQVVLSPGPSRSAVFEVPRTVDGSTEFSLHHFFFVVGEHDRTTSPVFTEPIVAREVVFDDATGAYSSVGFIWSEADSPVPNYTSGVTDVPHVFRGLVWGVRGSTVRYGFHLLVGDGERWDDNGGHGWTITL
ncbi:hypothetical protein AB0J83_20480 [Actinoplanes sp. NPDC049596]|uniref:hypothetical protein n=1 Tax=unclassified Actinoplanes TaxID=2626549 RepID=UPI0034256AAF